MAGAMGYRLAIAGLLLWMFALWMTCAPSRDHYTAPRYGLSTRGPQRSLFAEWSGRLGIPHSGPRGYKQGGSQFFQDEAVWELVYARGRQGKLGAGVFVEFGASDGFYHSNTVWFERALGWGGVLIEGDPELAKNAREVRDAERTQVVRAVVCDEPREVVFARFNVVGHSGLMTESEIEAKLQSMGSKIKILERIKTPCKKLETLLEEGGIKRDTRINFMSVDVEGAEVPILKSFDFNAWRVDVVMVEIDKPGAAGTIRDIMKATGLYNGPYRIDVMHPDDIWVRKDMETNPLDSFEVACEESCRRLTLCTRWDHERRECY